MAWMVSRAHRMAAATAAPDEMPHRRPSSSASRLAITTLSFEEMAITSSIMSRLRTFGMKPAPMPWICVTGSELWDVLCRSQDPEPDPSTASHSHGTSAEP